VLQGGESPDGSAPTYLAIALLRFDSLDAFKAAAAQHGQEIFGDIPRFTNTSPVLQFSTPLN
jgi:uncharacterized protein (TIGR02118 family)